MLEHMQHAGEALGAVMGIATPSNNLVVSDVPDAPKAGLAAMSPTYLHLVFAL